MAATCHHEKAKRACHECNRKKTKCDMQRPICQLCARSGSECFYPVNRRASTRQGTTKPSRSKSESRLVRLIRLWEHENELSSELGAQAEDRRKVQAQLTMAIERLLTPVSEEDSSPGRSSITIPVVPSPQKERSAPDSEEHDTISSTLAWSMTPCTATAISQVEGQDEENIFSQPSALPAAHDSRAQWRDTINVRVSEQQQHNFQSALPLGIPVVLACELVDLFFLKIQPWLPLLHHPNFQKWLSEIINLEETLMSEKLRPQDEFLMSSLMALSARFSSDPLFEGMSPPERGQSFADHARVLQKQLDLSHSHTLVYLQGCILLAFHCYCSGPTAEGWILSGVCTRIAYELGLAEIDGQAWSPFHAVDDVSKEEARRAWWLVWELDSFASIVSRRPFAIDRRRINLLLPVSDEVWFSGNITPSCKLECRLASAWRTLRDNKIQHERAWFLTAIHFVAIICDRIQQKSEVHLDEVLAIENEIACFKLAMPPNFRIDREPLVWNERTFPKCNWIIGTQIILMACIYMLNFLREDKANVGLARRVRAIELSRLLRQWSGDYVALASPLHATSMLAPPLSSARTPRDDAVVSSSQELAHLFLALCGEKWTLGSVVLGTISTSPLLQTRLTPVAECSKVLDKIEPLNPQEQLLTWRYALFFPSYGTVELGQSESRIFAGNGDNSLRPSPSSNPNALHSDHQKEGPQHNYAPETAMVAQVGQTGQEPPPNNTPLMPTTTTLHDWPNLFWEPSVAADETSTVPSSFGSDDHIARVSFPYFNYLGTLT